MSEGEDAGLDLETMMEQMRVLTEYANEHLAEPQRGLTYGSYWARFYDIRDRLVIFGYVEPLDTMDRDRAGTRCPRRRGRVHPGRHPAAA